MKKNIIFGHFAILNNLLKLSNKILTFKKSFDDFHVNFIGRFIN